MLRPVCRAAVLSVAAVGSAPKSSTASSTKAARAARLDGVLAPLAVRVVRERFIPARSAASSVLPWVTWPLALTLTLVKRPGVVMAGRVAVMLVWPVPCTSPVRVTGPVPACVAADCATAWATKAVVARLVLLSVLAWVGAVGWPVRLGLWSGAIWVASVCSVPPASVRPGPIWIGSGPPGWMLARPSSVPWAKVSFGCKGAMIVASVMEWVWPDWSSARRSVGAASMACGNWASVGMGYPSRSGRSAAMGSLRICLRA